MIKRRDWIIFLENGVSIEELPLSEDHRRFCEKWIKQHSVCTAEVPLNFAEGIERPAYHEFDLDSFILELHQVTLETIYSLYEKR